MGKKIVCKECYVKKKIKDCHTYCFSYGQELRIRKRAKKEVFDDIESISFLPRRDGKIDLKNVSLIHELKKKHLG